MNGGGEAVASKQTTMDHNNNVYAHNAQQTVEKCSSEVGEWRPRDHCAIATLSLCTRAAHTNEWTMQQRQMAKQVRFFFFNYFEWQTNGGWLHDDHSLRIIRTWTGISSRNRMTDLCNEARSFFFYSSSNIKDKGCIGLYHHFNWSVIIMYSNF